MFAAILATTAGTRLITVTPPGSPVTRQFLLSTPAATATERPAVVLLHGASETPYLLSKAIGFDALIAERGWVGAMPFGLSSPLVTRFSTATPQKRTHVTDAS